MVFVRPLGEAERRELKRLARREVGRVSERIRMVLLSSRGYSVPRIAEIFECDEATVRGWLERFAGEGVAGLCDRPRAGRPRKADAAAREVIRQQVETSPAEAGYLFGCWTVATLAAHLAAAVGLRVSQATVRRALLALGFRWRRPKHALPQDPQAASKMWALCEPVLRAPHDAVVLCLDECDLHLLPVLRAMWMRRGRQARVPTPGTNRKRSIFGALEWTTGRWAYAIFERKRSVEFLAFLEQLVQAYPGRPLLVVLDNASIHTAKVVQQWLAEHPQVELLFLPTYSGHEQNPVEKVWWRLKGHVAANRLHGSIDSLVAAVHEFFASFTPAAARQLAA
jgi:putative transposase